MLVPLHELERRHGQLGPPHGLRAAGHGARAAVGGSAPTPRSTARRRSPSVTMPVRRPAASTTPVQPSPLGAHRPDDGLERSRLRHHRHLVAPVHQLGHADQAAADGASRVESRHVVGAETAAREHGDGQGVAERERGRRRRGGREVHGARFLADRDVEHEVGVLREPRGRPPRQRHERDRQPLDGGHQRQELFGLPAVGQGDDQHRRGPASRDLRGRRRRDGGKSAGVPVAASVAASFFPTSPDFPMPVTTTRPRHVSMRLDRALEALVQAVRPGRAPPRPRSRARAGPPSGRRRARMDRS